MSTDFAMVEDNAQLIVHAYHAVKHTGPTVFRLGDGTNR